MPKLLKSSFHLTTALIAAITSMSLNPFLNSSSATIAPMGNSSPGMPISPHISEVETDRLILDWDAPLFRPDLVTDYEIRHSKNSGLSWHLLEDGISLETDTELDFLLPEVDYWIQIRSIGMFGNSDWTDVRFSKQLESQVPTQLSTGSSHSCVLKENKSISCWGTNLNGQLGNDTLLNNHIPTSVKDSAPAAQVSAGSLHTCAMLTTGGIECWGYNSEGQLGDGTTTSKSTPVEVENITNAIQVSTASQHTCALIVDGTIKCWGYNSEGQLGDGTTTSKSTPVEVENITNAIQVSTASQHTCALIADGTIKCWGLGGLLGDGSTSSKSIPVTVSGINSATQVSSEGNFTCALLRDSTIRCWGSNSSGTLGDGSTTSRTLPVTVAEINTAVQISSGSAHSCALLETGSIKCWGSNFRGALGDGTNFGRLSPVTVVDIENAIEVSAGELSTCAMLSDKRVKCWGVNDSGQLGANSNLKPWSFTPVIVEQLVNAQPTEFISLPRPPTLPIDITFGSWNQSSISLTWGPPPYTGGLEIIEYKISWSIDGVNYNNITTGSATTSHTITGLEPNTSYFIKVTAKTAAGWGETSTPVTMRTAYLPSKTTGLKMVAASTASIDLSWTSPYTDGLNVIEYKVEYSKTGTSWSSMMTTSPSASITGLEQAWLYKFRVSARTAAGWGPTSDVVEATTTGTRSMRLLVKSAQGIGVSGGAISWRTKDGALASAQSYGLTQNGVLDFPRVPAALSTVTASNLQLADGSTVSGSWEVLLGRENNELTIPSGPGLATRTIKVTLPNGLPVAGASVAINSLTNSVTQNGFSYFAGQTKISGVTNAEGIFTAVGYSTNAPTATVSYNDGVLIQTKSVSLNSSLTTVALDEMPWIQITKSVATAKKNALVSIPVVLRQTVPLKVPLAMGLAPFSLAGVQVSVTPPAGAPQKCKGKVLSAKTSAAGKATLKVCATKSGEYKLRGKGAAVTGSVQLRVSGTAPLPVTAASGVSETLGSAKIAWNAPVYTGGAPIKNYVVVVTGGGKTLKKTVTARSVTFTGLKNATTHTATIQAVTKFGTSDKVTISVGVS